ncbi:DUF6702 family protein [Cognatitamlana onchidii]|uniref:DUF6702 family protein n=1 Tax=Cognatitamlana onchidii TaxID=2562860 RepID=UPI0010A5F82A|nr:DUF6702 family protein [Algibacter onchidii]
MRYLRIILFFVAIPLLAFSGMHKYYVSVTQVEYVQDKQSIQIISRIFIDDFEKLLQERYDENIILAGKTEQKIVELYIERYLKEKLKIKINETPVELNYIGKEYDVDVVKCYLEIINIKDVKSFEVSNKVLFDVFSDQQNIVKTKINSKEKSFILYPKKDTAVLKFN